MAEFIFKDLVKKEGLSEKVLIQSAATSSEEIGNGVYPPARAMLAKYGISCSGKTAVQLKSSDYEKYDYLIAMEEYNIKNMMRIVGHDKNHKMRLLLEFTSNPDDISDPWYTGDFQKAYDDILKGCTSFLEYLKEEM